MNVDEIVEKSFASQGKRELKRLLEILISIKPKVILEIGVDRGGSINVWRKVFPEAYIIGIDISGYADFTGCSCKTIGYSQSEIVQTLTQDVLREHKFDYIDFLFIDGDHMEKSVWDDFNYYSSLVKKGGIIALHDVWLEDNPAVEVYKVWKELKHKYNYEEFHFDEGTGTGVIFI